MQFGSKIDKNGGKREEYFTVKEIISPEILKLNNGLTIRLLGVKQNISKSGKATDFLVKRTQEQKVFLKYDRIKYDSENRLFCYLYLQNKAFINAHLIKSGLTDVDEEHEYKYKEKFLEFKGVTCCI